MPGRGAPTDPRCGCLDVRVVVTTGGRHALQGLGIPPGLYHHREVDCPPLELGTDEDSSHSLQVVKSMARRDGGGCAAGVATAAGPTDAEAGAAGESPAR